MKKRLRSFGFAFLALGSALVSFAQHQTGDIVTVGTAKLQLLSNNLIPNPGFEDGFTNWTDATSSAAELSSTNFTLVATGGIDNSKYIVGTKNEGAAAAGSIGTAWPIESGKTYYFSYNVKYADASAGAGTETWLKVSLTNDKTSSQEPFKVLDSGTVNGGGAWTVNKVAFTNSNNYSYIVARFRWLSNRLGFDNFSLHQALELPNTDALQESIDEAQRLYDAEANGAAELQAAITTAQGFLTSTSTEEVAKALEDLQAALGKYKLLNANLATLQERIDEAQRLYKPDAEGAAELQEAITLAQSFLTSTSAEEVSKATENLNTAITAYRILNASSQDPVDVTHFIVNQGFDDNNSTGWTGGGTVNYHSVEFYEKTFNMYQTITGLPAGKYSMKVQGFERPKGNDGGAAYRAGTETIYAEIYAKGENSQERTTPFNSLYKHSYTGTGSSNGYVNTMASAEIMFTNTENEYYEMILPDILLGEGESLVIGAKSNFQQGGYWALFDNFRLQYEGFDINDVVTLVNELLTEAQELATRKMQASVLSELNTTITQAQAAVAADPLVTADLYSSKAQLLKMIETASVSVAAYSDLQAGIDAAVELYADGSAEGADDLQAAINEAQTLAANLNASLDEIYAGTKEIGTATFAFMLANGTGTVPTVVTNPKFARGATMAFGRSTVSGVSTSALLERGFCWSTDPEPTVLDNRTTNYVLDNSNAPVYKLENLTPATIYYMRAYAITKDYAVGYGDILKVITIPKGSVTYTLTSSVTNSGEHYPRIKSAIEDAVDYFNNLTSIQGHHLTVSYHSGTPTAEASYGGYLQFGANPAYQKTGTALHEMGHTIGVGQHWYWYNTSGSPLKVNGVWLGDRATEVVRFLDNNNSSTMKGDGTHMWPYGINGAHEDTGSEFLYIGNSLVHQALGEDGLPPNNGGFTTPSYTFDYSDGVKYYIKSEDESMGRNTSYLIEGSLRRITNKVMTADEALASDSAAWYFDFDPATCYYRIRNAATGKYFTYSSTGTNGIRLVEKATPAAAENFQLMKARIDTKVTAGTNSFITRGYWITRPEKTGNPPTLAALATGFTSASTFNIQNTATTQRWLILTGDEVERFDEIIFTGLQEVTEDQLFDVMGGEGEITIHSDDASLKKLNIYSVTGQVIMTIDITSGQLSVPLPKGIYIVAKQKVVVL